MSASVIASPSNSGNSTNPSLTWSSPTAGNLLVCFMQSNSSDNPSTPSGWTAFDQQQVVGNITTTWYYKLSDGTETTVNWGLGAAVDWITGGWEVDRIDSSPVDIDGGASNTSASPNVSGQITTANQAAVLIASHHVRGSLTGFPTSGYTNLQNVSQGVLTFRAGWKRQTSSLTNEQSSATHSGTRPWTANLSSWLEIIHDLDMQTDGVATVDMSLTMTRPLNANMDGVGDLVTPGVGGFPSGPWIFKPTAYRRRIEE